MRARHAADEFTTAARSAAEAARIAADQFVIVARAATEAGREAWRRERQGVDSHEAARTHVSVSAPPPYEVIGAPGPDDAHAEEVPRPGV